jgi:hypothetical protein
LARFDSCVNLTGDISSLSNLKYRASFNNCTKLTGNILALSDLSSMASFDNCTNLTGDISTLSNLTYHINFKNCFNITGVLNPKSTIEYVYLNYSGLSTSDVDQAIINLNNITTVSGTLDVSGMRRTIVSTDAINSLITKGWSVTDTSLWGNLVYNNHFDSHSDTWLSDWSLQGSGINVTDDKVEIYTLANNYYRLNGAGKNALTVTSGHIYFGAVKMFFSPVQSVDFYLYIYDGTYHVYRFDSFVSSTGDQQYEIISGRTTPSISGTSYTRVGVIDSLKQNYFIDRTYGVYIIDLTEDGDVGLTDTELLTRIDSGYYD